MQATLHLVAGAAPRQNFHLIAVLHGDDVASEQTRLIGEGEVALRLAEDENPAVDGDLALLERRVQHRGLGVPQRARPELEQQPDEFVVGSAGDAVVDAGPQAISCVGVTLRDALAVQAESLDGLLVGVVGEGVDVAVVEHRGGRDTRLLGDVAQSHALEPAREHRATDGVAEHLPFGSLVLLPGH